MHRSRFTAVATGVACVLLAGRVGAQAQEQPPAAKPGPASETSRVLDALATAMNRRAAASERAAALQTFSGSTDSRVVAVLEYLSRDDEPAVRAAAISALSTLRGAAAQEALLGAARDATAPNDVREASIRSLWPQDPATAVDRLEQLMVEPKLPKSLALLAREELAEHAPERLRTSTAAQRALNRGISGQQILIASGVFYGSYSLFAIGQLGGTAEGTALGLLGGAVLGGAAGYLLGEKMTPSHALTYTTGIGWGLWAGLAIGLAAHGPSDARSLHLYALGGEIVGAVGAALLWKTLQPLLDTQVGGTDWALVASGALVGAPLLHLAAQINNPGPTLQAAGLISGALLGGLTASLIGRGHSPVRGAYTLTGTAWTMATAGLLMTSFGTPQPHQAELAILGGAALGLTAAQLTWSDALQLSDIAEINATAATAFSLGMGFSLLDPIAGNFRPLPLVTAAGLIGGRLLAPKLHFAGSDVAIVGLSVIQGAMVGALLPSFFTNTPLHLTHAGLLLGIGGGAIAGTVAAQLLDVPPAQVGVVTVSDVLGSAVGMGINLLATSASTAPRVNAGLFAGSLLGLAVGTQLAPRVTLTSGGGTLTLLSSVLGAAHGVAISSGLQASPAVVGGATLLGTGLGGYGGLLLGAAADPSPGWVAAQAAGALWGAWLSVSVLGLAKPQLEAPDALIVLGATDVGLAVTSLLLSRAVGATPRQVGIVTLFGFGGTVLFTLGRALAPSDPRSLLAFSLIGSAVGLGAGVAVVSLGGRTEETTAPRRSTLLPRFRGLSTAGLQAGRGEGLQLTACFDLG